MSMSPVYAADGTLHGGNLTGTEYIGEANHAVVINGSATGDSLESDQQIYGMKGEAADDTITGSVTAANFASTTDVTGLKIWGGYSEADGVTGIDNKVRWESSAKVKSITTITGFEAYAPTSANEVSATGTTVTVNGATVANNGKVYGANVKSGSSQATATGTTVTLTDTKAYKTNFGDGGFSVYGAYVESGSGDATATGTQVTLTKTELGYPMGANEYVYGANVKSDSGKAMATGTTLTLTDTTAKGNNIIGGAKVEGKTSAVEGETSATATDTKVIMTGGRASNLNGVEVNITSAGTSKPYGKAEATGTTLTINGAILDGPVRGALVNALKDGKASDTKITITGGEIYSLLNAAEVRVNEAGSIGEANNTTLIINGTEIAHDQARVQGAEVSANAGDEILSAKNTTVKLLNVSDSNTLEYLVGVSIHSDTGHIAIASATVDTTEVEMTGGKVKKVVGAEIDHAEIVETKNKTSVTLNNVTAESVTGVHVIDTGTDHPVITMMAKTNNTTVTLNDVTVHSIDPAVNSDVTGVFVDRGVTGDDVTATNTDVRIEGATTTIGGSVYGVNINGDGDATNNTVTINDASVGGDVYGVNITGDGEATKNTVTLTDATVTGYVYGGKTDGGAANDNTVTMTSGKAGSIVGGKSTGEATGNTVEFSGGKITNNLYGGESADSDNNTLISKGNRSVGGNVNFFQKYSFVLGDDNVGLTAGGTFTLDPATNNILGVDALGGGNSFKKGDTLTLVKAGTLDDNAGASSITAGATGTGKKGASLFFDYRLDPVNYMPNSLTAKVTNVRINPQTKSFLEGRIAGITTINQAGDMLAGKGIAAARAVTESTGFGIYAATSGGTNRYKTGSHVDLDSISFILGAGWRKNTGSGALLFSPFFEFGWGKYKAHNDFSGFADVNAKGNTNYQGGGLLARYDHCNGVYAEASFRLGRLHQSYNTSDLTDVMGHGSHYKYNQLYTSLHLGIGRKFALGMGELDVYGKYFWTRTGKKDVTVLDDPISFDATHSHRMRLGARYTHAVSAAVKPYAGAGFEYEFAGKAKGKAYRLYDINSPRIKGGSGLLEAGIDYTPCGKKWTLNGGVTGFVGKRRGIMGQLGIKADF